MTKISAKIIADSINPQGHRITSFILTYPRMIHGELMTHRVFSRNSASSRAIPFKKMMEMVEKDPFIPIAWQKDHKGMQGTEYFTKSDLAAEEFKEEIPDTVIEHLTQVWLTARDNAVRNAKYANEIGLTKQLCNRLLEPFMWHTVLVTATEFDNFFELRCPKYQTPVSRSVEPQKSWKDLTEVHSNPENLERLEANKNNWIFKMQHSLSAAEIHIQALAEAMWDEYNQSKPKQLNAGEWHIPFGDTFDENELTKILNRIYPIQPASLNWQINQINDLKIKIATARCARLSYMTFEGKIDYEKDIALHDQLLASHHMSPFEHCARAMTDLEYYSFIKGEVPTYHDGDGILNYEYYPYSNGKTNRDGKLWMGFIGENPNNGNRFGWCNNLRGFIQYRYLVESQTKK